MSQIQKLQDIANKTSRRIVGLMSGTSLDGLDIAVCNISGYGYQSSLQVEQFITIPYNQDLVNEIRSIFSKKQVDLEKLCLLNEGIGFLHGQLVKEQLSRWDIATSDVDLIASHGQTIYHAPQSSHNNPLYPNATLQIGDGDHVARATGIITVADFRQRHVAAGGEGAPLVAYGDSLLFSDPYESRILLNIGGISNFTMLPSQKSGAAVICSDIGPGNTMMDALVQSRCEKQRFDKNAELAYQGQVNSALLKELTSDAFFKQSFPKTTGPELFNLDYLGNAQSRSETTHLSTQDLLATLNKFSADVISASLKPLIDTYQVDAVYVSGGGALNPLLMEHLVTNLANVDISKTDVLGIDPEAKEAILFALLANQCFADEIENKQAIKGMPDCTMGKICFPN